MYQLINLVDHLNEICIPFYSLPNEVQLFINDVLATLDDNYHSTRDPIKDLGGYVIGIEAIDDLNHVTQMTGINFDTAVCELVDFIKGYYCCLVLLGSDYGLYFIIPESLTPVNVRNQINH